MLHGEAPGMSGRLLGQRKAVLQDRQGQRLGGRDLMRNLRGAVSRVVQQQHDMG